MLQYEKVLRDRRCPKCREGKDVGVPFCRDCLDKLPHDLRHDLFESNGFTQVAAFADATTFLMNDWR